jgi:hypothetical protein
MLSLHDTEVLRRSGFIQMEIEELNHWTAADGTPQHVDLSTPGWKMAMKTRETFFKRMKKSGMNYPKYEKKVQGIYQKLKDTGEQDDTIATFLRAEYSKVAAKKTDYQQARENRALGIVKKAMYAKIRGK